MNEWERRVGLVIAACCAEYESYVEGHKDAETALKNTRKLLELVAGTPMTPEQRARCQEDPEGVGAELARRARE